MRSILISLGGARYQSAPQLIHAAFGPSSRAIAGVLTHTEHGIVEPRDHLDLFDDDRSWPDQLIEARNWIRSRIQEANNLNVPAPQNILVHYVGHGWFSPNSEDHYLTINRTDFMEKAATSAVLGQLNGMLLREAGGLRRYYLIDACFAAASLRNVMAGDNIIEKELGVIIGAWPEDESGERGVAALCSADKDTIANAGGEGAFTQFTDGILTVLKQGDADLDTRLSLRKVYEMLRIALRHKYREEMVHPVLVAPNDRDGGIAGVPLFLNLAGRQNDRRLGRVAGVVVDVLDTVREALAGPATSQSDIALTTQSTRATDSTGASTDPESEASPSHKTPVDVTLVDGSEHARALEIALSEDVSFRRLVYRFFRLSQSKKKAIVDRLRVRQAGDACLSELDRFKVALTRVRDNGQMKRLETLISDAERNK